MEESNLIKERYKKLEAIQGLGIRPFGGRYDKKESVGTIASQYEEHREVKTAGRLTAMRQMGKSTFCDIKDETGRIQLYLKKEELPGNEGLLFDQLDLGDILGIEGHLFKTKTGEISIRVEHLTLLSKSLRPMPEKWHGLKDVESRYRQRYLDLIANDEVKDLFRKRSMVVRSIRKTLDDLGYLEVETPMMHSIAGGAAGKPFKTHHEALDLDLFLRVAPELYLKKLLVGGYDKVYEINKSFRNEGISTRHNPEFTMLEVYTAYQDVHDVMDLAETIIKNAAKEVFGSHVLTFGDQKLDLTHWERVSFAKLMKENFDIHPDDELASWIEKLKKKGVKLEKNDISRTGLINLIGELIEPGKDSQRMGRPIFVTDYFTELCPLAKKNPDNPLISERFELFVSGMELANGYSELNDPIDQKQRFIDELKEKNKPVNSDTLDEDFVHALECGMPPAGGLGIGVDRLVMLLTGQSSIREVILFPQMKKG